MAVDHLFRFTAPPGIGGYTCPTWGTVRRRDLDLPTARDLWERGCPYLELTHEGARSVYADAGVKELRALVHRCRTTREVQALAALRADSRTLQAAADARLAHLTANA